MVKTVVVGGTTSGVGKTTVAAGLVAALARRGYKVQAFKVGPDYIDPTYLSLASGSPGSNLDAWLLPSEAVLELFHRAAATADVAIVEGVMGLFDGHSPDDDTGSTAEVAKLLNAPVLLVADTSKVGRSLAATVMGFKAFDPSLNITGVILNGISGESHLSFVKCPVESATRLPVVGYLPHRDELRLPERHLGLIPAMEEGVSTDLLEILAHQIEQTVDLDRLLGQAQEVSGPLSSGSRLFPGEGHQCDTRIAVAQDRAFSFYYQDSLDLLEAWGAEIVPFDTLTDDRLPNDVSGVYIGGGFPEVFAEELASNEPVKESLRRAAARGMPVYAECGGLMYLGERLTDFEGNDHPMVGLVEACSAMTRSHLSLGYRTVEALSDGPMLKKEERVRGHEFHWSVLSREPDASCAVYGVTDQGGRLEGFRTGSVLASYLHVHMGSGPHLAPNFVKTCSRWAGR